jgi:hypothetical protein
MEPMQPNQTLTNIAVDLEQLAARADQLVPTLSADAAQLLTEELCAIRALIDEATDRLSLLQAVYPEQLDVTV